MVRWKACDAMNSCIYSGFRWLLTSGVQDESGGVARDYLVDEHSYGSLATAATGFYISAMLKANESSEPEPIEHAKRAGRFLVERAFDSNLELFLVEVGPEGSEPRLEARFLDCCIAARALLHLWQATGEHVFLDHAERCGVALRTRMSRVDGSFFPLLDLQNDQPSAGTGSWAVKAEVYQLKSALAFLELSDATGNREFNTSTEKMLSWCLKTYEGFVRPDDDPEKVVDQLHAYCYFLEGLLPIASEDMKASNALQRGVLEVENRMREIAGGYQRCDVVAQLLRLRLYADRIGIMELDAGEAEKEALLIEQFQHQSTDPKVDGGFAFARRNGQAMPQVNPATTAVALQALAMWEQAEDGAFREPWQTLI
jgi:hypothetical protein